LRHISVSLQCERTLNGVLPALDAFYLQEVQLDRGLTTEDAHEDTQLAALHVDLVDYAG